MKNSVARWGFRCAALAVWALLVPSAWASNDAQFISQAVPSKMTEGQSYTVSVTMKNTGTTTWIWRMAYYLGSENPHGNRTWGMRAVPLSASESIPPGAEKTFMFTVIAPSAPGSYNFQWRMAQPGIGSFGEFTPNVVVTVAPSSIVDLTMTAVTGPASAAAGGLIQLTNTVLNQGTDSSEVFGIGLYLSTDPFITTEDVPIGARFLSNGLGAGASDTATTYALIPAVTAPGAYYVGALADVLNRIAEVDEANNASAGEPIQVSAIGNADLVVSSVLGPSSATMGSAITALATLQNQGSDDAGAFLVGLFLSADAAITTEDIPIGAMVVNNLTAGSKTPVVVPGVIHDKVAPGAYYLGAIADALDFVPETDEANNSRRGNSIVIQ